MKHITLDNGAVLAVFVAGEPDKPALLLIHGFPSSSESFRGIVDSLTQHCFVIAPDLPGFGRSAPIEQPSFSGYADLIQEVVAKLGVDSFHLYLHDYGAVVGLHLATRAPGAIRSLIVQNANAHESGLGPQWSATKAYWKDPTPERELEATAHLNLEGTRAQYVGGVPQDITRDIEPSRWVEDFRIMSLPGRLQTQRALVLDYRSHVARFDEIAHYLARFQPPALMLWGRHDTFFDIEETLSWMKALPRMEAHIFDGPHFLLETHACECATLIGAFVRAVEGNGLPECRQAHITPLRIDTVSSVVEADAHEVYRAFADPRALIEWLPPSDMTGRVLEYDFREGGRYRIELKYSPETAGDVGKTTGHTDITAGRFIVLKPGERIVQSVEFESADASFAGEMTMTWVFEALASQTRVTVTAQNVPAGITQADHETGIRGSLNNLARFLTAA